MRELFLPAAIFQLSVLTLIGDLPPLDHYDGPLPEDSKYAERITFTPSRYPTNPASEIVSTDGHRCAFDFHTGGDGHSNAVDLHFRFPGKPGSKVHFQVVYWDFGTRDLRWINENLLFVRIWWGRHWGSDYIIIADTGKIAFRDGFAEHHSPISFGQ